MLSEKILQFSSYVFYKLLFINYFILIILSLIFSIGIALLYSAAGGSMDPWASKQLIRFIISIILYLTVSIISIKFWLGTSYYIYIISLILLISVNYFGNTGLGAQRWINLGFFNLQPSELMKFAILLSLAKYFHAERDLSFWNNIKNFIIPLFLILIPAYVIFIQPDLGSSLILLMASLTILFVIGLSIWFFVFSCIISLIMAPFAWLYLLYDYQKDRILTFLDPLRDPLGAGYHIIQSKIALGSGGLFGKGFLNGSQSHLNFLPEMQTDFIFTLLAEEFGIFGSLILLSLFIVLIIYTMIISFICKSRFACFIVIGVAINIFFYVFINTAMVTGLIPVVGVPLPLVSYGGTSMMCVMFGMGLVSNAYLNRNIIIPRYKDGLFGW
ncbi:MAG: Rod shape-determining protein RodA [Alphaproteobacteria bacterium MarineAlpha9_Bin3]|nr:MAG: Rod shape-determining protein RodA [Alphaproteobacteria bacterium MarineAlpha9_Bin3]|tara:strand:- start:1536 stop:2693 length:1158 start_codon:yes stop_codon:yes gene_type:complete